MMFLSTLVSIILLLSLKAAAADPSTGGYGNNTNSVCTLPFYLVGDKCLIISNDFRGTWSQMRELCLLFDGDLVSLGNANLLYDIKNYIIAHGMSELSYWTGGNDRDNEGQWIWASDNSELRMTSSVWGQLYGDQPDGGINENCACISNREYFFMRDENCESSMNGVICQAKQNGALKTTKPMPNIECPPTYVMMDSGCFQVHSESEYSYSEAIELCSGPFSHLAKMDDANTISDIRQYLIGQNALLWTDGSDELEEGNWIHTDGTPMKMGTPFWRVYDEGQIQDPDLNDNYRCRRSNAGSFYHFYDAQCTTKAGALCEYDIM